MRPLTVARLQRMAITILALLLCGGLASGVATAGAADPSASPSPSQTTLHIGWTLEPDNLNPFIGWSVSNWIIWQLNYDTLTGFSASSQQPVPRLATSWEHSPDGKTWTFKLRDDVKWQDGEPFTSKDVAFTFNYAIDNQMTNLYTYIGSIDRVVAVDDYTVRFECSKPKANMLAMLVNILPEHIWSKLSPKEASQSFTNPPPIVGTGAFQVVEFKPGKFVRLVANRDYWGPKPKVDEIIFQLYQNPDTMASDLKTGAIQGARDIPPAVFESLGAAPGLGTIEAAMNGIQYLGMNCYAGKSSLGNPVLRDPAFRTALQWAIDKQRIVDVAYSGHGQPATSMVRAGLYPGGVDYHWQPLADQLFAFDPVKAGQMLDAAGYPLKNGVRVDKSGKPIQLRLWAPTSNVSQQTAGKLLAGWFTDIGLQITFSVLDTGAIYDAIANFNAAGDYAPDFDMQLSYLFGDPDPNFMFSAFTTGQLGYLNDIAWSNAEYDRLFEQQQTTIDQAARTAIVQHMQQIVYEQNPMIVFLYPEYLEGYNDEAWGGWVRSPEGIGSFVYSIQNPDNYISVHAVVAASSNGGSSSATWVALVAAVIAVLVVIFVVVRRRRGRAVEQA